jgi:hypothetical protein
MSNYTRLTKHPETGSWSLADWLDDYFGHHRYGVRFRGEDRTFRENEVDHSEASVEENMKAISEDIKNEGPRRAFEICP